MSSKDIKNKDNPSSEANEVKLEGDNHSFIQEKIKERPINKKKLVRKMIMTASAALLFGVVACSSIFFLEPLFSKLLNRDSDNEFLQVTIPEIDDNYDELPEAHIDTNVDEDGDGDGTVLVEMPIEDMIVDGVTVSGNGGATILVPSSEITLEDYQLLYRKLYALSKEISRSVVTVTGYTSDSEWYSSSFVSQYSTAGAIVGNNGVDYLILVDNTNLQNAEAIRVTFCDGSTAGAFLKGYDKNTNLAVYAVPIISLPAQTRQQVEIITIGSSVTSGLLGNAVMAIGYPLGETYSVCYGAITSNTRYCQVTDGQYQIVTTDIYGSPYASGIIANARGQIVGFINQRYNEPGMGNLISGYGMSGIKRLVENISNGNTRCYVGLYLVDVSKEAYEELGVPEGAYVTKVDMNSPAMSVGIIAGDVIVKINDNNVKGVNDYMMNLSELKPEDTVTVSIERLSGDSYKTVTVDIKVEELL